MLKSYIQSIVKTYDRIDRWLLLKTNIGKQQNIRTNITWITDNKIFRVVI